jgi:hypothetical protein
LTVADVTCGIGDGLGGARECRLTNIIGAHIAITVRAVIDVL